MKKQNRTLAALSNDQLIRKGDRAVRTRHELAIEILDCLVEIERRDLHLKGGYSSLFDYCTRRWHYSPPKAGRTIAAARCVKKFPGVRSLLVDRKITVCGVARIAGVLTDENSDRLIREVSGKKYIEIEKIVASQRTAPVIREFVRPIGVKASTDREKSAGDSQFESLRTDQPTLSGTEPASRTDLCEEKVENRYEIRFSASEGFFRKLKRAQAICSRSPGLESVLEKALDELLEKHDPERREARRVKRKSARRVGSGREPENGLSLIATSHTSHDDEFPRPNDAPMKRNGSSGASRNSQSKHRSRHIPAGIRDAVFKRDGGRCTYVGKNGVRCGATAFLQIDHIRPFCLGGEHTLDNLRLLCGKHNRLTARKLSLSTGRKPPGLSVR